MKSLYAVREKIAYVLMLPFKQQLKLDLFVYVGKLKVSARMFEGLQSINKSKTTPNKLPKT